MAKYTQEEKLHALALLDNHSVAEVSMITGVAQATLRAWKSANKRTKADPQTLSFRVNRVKAYLLKKHKSFLLTNKQAVDTLMLESGRELGTLLGTPKLEDLSINAIARYIVLYT